MRYARWLFIALFIVFLGLTSTSEGLTQTTPSNGNQKKNVGFALSSTSMFSYPSPNYLEVP